MPAVGRQRLQGLDAIGMTAVQALEIAIARGAVDIDHDIVRAEGAGRIGKGPARPPANDRVAVEARVLEAVRGEGPLVGADGEDAPASRDIGEGGLALPRQCRGLSFTSAYPLS